jgi:purine catabolism regulator
VLTVVEAPAATIDLIRYAAGAGAAAVGISIRPGKPPLDDAIMELANGLDFPVIDVPWRIYFSDISDLVSDYLLSARTALLRQSLSIVEHFTNLAAEATDVATVRRETERILGRTVRVIGPWSDAIDERDVPVASGSRVIALPIVAGGRSLGKLLINTEVPLSEADARTAAAASMAVGLLLQRQEALLHGEVLAHSEFLAQLFAGHSGWRPAIEERAAALGLEWRASHTVIVLGLATDEPSIRVEPVRDTARSVIDHAFKSYDVRALQGWFGNNAAILLPVRSESTWKKAGHVLSLISARVLSQHDSRIIVRAGIGREVATLADAGLSYQQASLSYRTASALSLDALLTRYDELGAYPALLAASTGEDGRPFFEDLHRRYLAPLLEYESRHGLRILDTVREFFACSGNVSATARRLSINRQSLLYRLAKIESLAAVQLSVPADRLALQIALAAWQVGSRANHDTSDSANSYVRAVDVKSPPTRLHS